MTDIIDISLPVYPQMPIYPGNQPTEFHTIKKPSGSQLTVVTIDSHAGTHIDAPCHAGLEGGIDVFSLDDFYGPARVIAIDGASVTEQELHMKTIQPGERILLKTTNSARGYDKFYDTWVGVEPEAAEYLASIGVRLVGIDWFGIKQKNAATNEAHTVLLSRNIPILEGITLDGVDEGEYLLSALPIAYSGIDGAPVRAVLIKEGASDD